MTWTVEVCSEAEPYRERAVRGEVTLQPSALCRPAGLR